MFPTSNEARATIEQARQSGQPKAPQASPPMTLRTFLNQNVNPSRGGYTPREVEDLCQQAWAESARETRQRLIEIVENLKLTIAAS